MHIKYCKAYIACNFTLQYYSVYLSKLYYWIPINNGKELHLIHTYSYPNVHSYPNAHVLVEPSWLGVTNIELLRVVVGALQ